MRLQKFLARAGAASRRGSEDLMTAGRVRVNGVVTSELGSKVDPSRDVVTVDGHVVELADKPVYLMLNKPAGYVTTMSDPQGRPCVASLVPIAEHPGLFPVGRLDRDTTGLLLFTTNGMVGQGLLHPSHHVSKHYVALVEGTPSSHELGCLRAGIVLDDGACQPAEAVILDPGSKAAAGLARGAARGDALVGITLHEGKKRQVKRMMLAIGHPVLRLRRDTFGPLSVEGLAEGSWRELTATETAAVLAAAGMGEGEER